MALPRNILLMLVGLVCSLVVGCFTPSKEKQIKDDMFNLQTRIMELEHSTDEKGRASEDTTNKRMASTNSQVERISTDIQKLRGDVDALRVGVVTGQMPGSDPEKEGSVAKTLNGIMTRLDAIEASQAELVAAIQKASDKHEKKDKKEKDKDKDKDSKAKSKSSGATSVADLQGAFDKNKFKFVVEEGPAVIKATKAKAEKETATYLYAESLFKVGNLRDAALKFNDYLDMKPAVAKNVPHAKMRLGDCFRHLGDDATAKLYYQELVSKYPESPEAEKAKERLNAFSTKGAAKKPKTGSKTAKKENTSKTPSHKALH